MTTIVRLLMVAMSLLSRGLKVIVGILLYIAPERLLPIVEWPIPDGPYAVGTRSTDFAGSESNGARRLMVRFWYPAKSVEGCDRRGYFGNSAEQEALIRGLGRDALMPVAVMRHIAHTLTWSYADAPAMRGERLPVVIFSHGHMGYVEQNTHLCENLASHGYLVISLAHPSGASVVQYGDIGVVTAKKAETKKLVTPQFIADMLAANKAPRSERLPILQRLANSPMAEEDRRWNEDISFAITLLSGSQLSRPTAGILELADWNRLALVGMSLGGSASASAAQLDSRVHAAVNLDGMQQGGVLLNSQIRVPLLVMHGRRALRADGTTITQEHYGNAQRWVVQGASHLDFTDITAFGRGLVRKALNLNCKDGVRMLQMTADITREFLDVHLRGGCQNGSQLDREQYPELIRIEA